MKRNFELSTFEQICDMFYSPWTTIDELKILLNEPETFNPYKEYGFSAEEINELAEMFITEFPDIEINNIDNFKYTSFEIKNMNHKLFILSWIKSKL